jgi:glycosyltransferase EpsD
MQNRILFCATVDYHFKAFHLPYMEWFQKQGWEVHVAATGDMILPFVDKKYNIPISRSPVSLKNHQAYKQLRKIISENHYKIVHCHTPVGGVLGRLAAGNERKKGTKVIYTAHGFHFCKGGPFVNWMIYYPIEKLLATYTDCLITINKEDYQLANKHQFKSDIIEHVHGVGVDIDIYKPVDEATKLSLRKKLGYKNNDFLLFYAAEFNTNKNQQLLIRALAQIKSKSPNIKLLLAGNGSLQEECRNLVRELGVDKMVDFLGFRNDIDKLLKISDIGVASSKREGLPVNIMEALASGLPIIATSNRGHKELIVNEMNGFLIPQGNSEFFSSKILELYSSKELCRKMALESIKGVKRFSLSKVKQEMIEIYQGYMVEDLDETKNKYHRAYI